MTSYSWFLIKKKLVDTNTVSGWGKHLKKSCIQFTATYIAFLGEILEEEINTLKPPIKEKKTSKEEKKKKKSPIGRGKKSHSKASYQEK